MSVEIKATSYEQLQKEYDRLYAEKPIRDEDRAYVWLAKELFKEKKARKVLDVACGAGYFLREIGREGGSETELYGIDFSKTALDLARNEVPNAVLKQSPAESLPFNDGNFDAITCLGSLEHFMDIGKAISEMKRVANDSAVILILVPNIFWYKDLLSVLFTGNRKDRNQIHEHFASLGEWKESFKKMGLEVAKTKKYNGIAKSSFKQWIKDLVIPLRFSYHFIFICRKSRN